MKIKNIAFVGIPVTGMKRSREFYEGVLGLKPDPEMTGEIWTEYSVGAGTIAIGCVGDQWKPSSDGTSVALEVDDFQSAIKHLKDANIPFDSENVESPVCRMAVMEDPDGNKLIIHKLKSEKEKGANK